MEGTYCFVVRVGLEKIRRETILLPEEKRKAMRARLDKARAKVVNPWDEHKEPFHPKQFQDFVLPKEREALIEPAGVA